MDSPHLAMTRREQTDKQQIQMQKMNKYADRSKRLYVLIDWFSPKY